MLYTSTTHSVAVLPSGVSPHEESVPGFGPGARPPSLALLAALCRDGVLIVDTMALVIEQQHLGDRNNHKCVTQVNWTTFNF